MTTKLFLKDTRDRNGCIEPWSLELIRTLWPKSNLSQQAFQDNDHSSFIAYLDREALELRKHQLRFASKTIHDTINLIYRLRCDLERPQQHVLEGMRNLFHDVDEAALIQTVKLAVRIWLTVDVRLDNTNDPNAHASINTIEWPTQTSLQEAIHSHFVPSEPDEWYKDTSRNQLDPSLTASSLIDICCIQIAWTHNLAEHLHLDKRRRILSIYEHKICLLNHLKDPSPPFPHSILFEAIDTLNLLFPFGHAPTPDLLRSERKMALYRLATCNRERTLAMSDYRVWGPRIAELIELFNEPPKNWWQLLCDRRNLRDWATFWTGIMVLILTLVSIAFGTLSSIYTIKQYNLALAQACASPDLAVKLVQFCK